MPNQFQPGLPGGQAAGSLLPVGSMMNLPTASGPLIVLGDGSHWLRTGSLADAAAYPQAARLLHLGAHAALTSPATGWANLQSFGAQAATNGAGLYLIAAVGISGAAMRRSTDGGTTWANQDASLGGSMPSCGCLWAGTRFVVGGNDSANNVSITTSTDGINYTTRYTGAVGSTAPGTIRFYRNADYSLIVALITGSATILTSADQGLTWTARGLGANVSQNDSAMVDGQRIFIIGLSGLAMYSTNAGVSFASVSLQLPAVGWVTANRGSYTLGGRFFFVNTSNVIWHTTDPSVGANWQSFMAPQGNGAALVPGGAYANGYFTQNTNANMTRIFASFGNAGIAYTDDGFTWRTDIVDGGTQVGICLGSTEGISLPNASSFPTRFAFSPGNPRSVGMLPRQAVGDLSTYVRIR